MRKKIALLIGLAVMPVAAASAQIGAPSPESLRRSEAAFDLVPGVLVDRLGNRIFLMSPERGIDALSLSSGNLDWSSDAAAKPLAIYGDVLIAQADSASASARMEVVLLDANRGGSPLETLALALPAGVFGRVDDGMGASFRATATVRDGVPLISWQSTNRRTKGTAPEPGETLERSQSAGYALDIQSLRLVPVAAPAAPQARAVLPQAVRAAVAAERFAEGPYEAGQVLAATQVVASNPNSPRLVLRRWDAGSGTALPEVELVRGPIILQLPSVDRRHLLVSESVAPGDAEEYRWSLFSLETGEQVGQIRHARSHAPFFVAGRSLVIESPAYGHRVGEEWVDEPRMVRAVVADGGALIWERPLRDTAYRGSYPP